MSRNAIRVLTGIPISTFLIVALLEILLRTLDPWGAYMFRDQQVHLADYKDGHGSLIPGAYHLTHTIVTVNEDGTRAVPSTNPDAACTIAFVGDSVTFGWAVNDNETWVNLLAQAFPDVRFLNAGISGFNSHQVLKRVQSVQADGYVYLIWRNDRMDNERYHHQQTVKIRPDDFYFELYLKYLILREQQRNYPEDDARFRDDLAALAEYPLLMIVNSNHGIADETKRLYPDTVLINWQYDPISVIDGHPNVAGHKKAAGLMLPAVSTFVDKICTGGDP